jgi:ankyrin repeat protein
MANAPLFEAVLNGDLEAVERLVLQHPEHIDIGHGEFHTTPLQAAAHDGQSAICDLLIKHGANVNSQDIFGACPLHEVAWQGHPQAALLLLEHGAEVNSQRSDGATPISLTIRHIEGCRAVAQILIERGASLDLTTAIRLGRYEYAHMLIRAGCEAIQQALCPEDLVLDVIRNHERTDEAGKMIAMLLSCGANVNGASSVTGDTPLIAACSFIWTSPDLIRQLLEAGADPTSQTFNMETAYQKAQSCGNKAAVAILRLYGICN